MELNCGSLGNSKGKGITMRWGILTGWRCIVLALLATPAHADPLDGLYRPVAPWASNWSCSREGLGQDGGSTGLLDGTLYGVESQCALGQARLDPNGPGRLYSAICSAEGEQAATEIKITPTDVGIDIARDGQTLHWQRCDRLVASTPPSGNARWVLGYGMGVSEAYATDRNGNLIMFTCTGGYDGGIRVELNGRPIPGGPVTFSVDGQRFEMSIWARGGDVNTGCISCAGTYLALRDAVARGRLLTIQSGEKTVSFGLAGSGKALAESCVPADSGG